MSLGFKNILLLEARGFSNGILVVSIHELWLMMCHFNEIANPEKKKIGAQFDLSR